MRFISARMTSGVWRKGLLRVLTMLKISVSVMPTVACSGASPKMVRKRWFQTISRCSESNMQRPWTMLLSARSNRRLVVSRVPSVWSSTRSGKTRSGEKHSEAEQDAERCRRQQFPEQRHRAGWLAISNAPDRLARKPRSETPRASRRGARAAHRLRARACRSVSMTTLAGCPRPGRRSVRVSSASRTAWYCHKRVVRVDVFRQVARVEVGLGIEPVREISIADGTNSRPAPRQRW